MERIPSGIEGLDKITGGFPKGRTVLITGAAGTGKTILALRFGVTSALSGLKTVFIATEEERNDLINQSASFGWEIPVLEKKGVFRLVELAIQRVAEFEAVKNIKDETGKGWLGELSSIIPEDTEVMILDSLGSVISDLSLREFRDMFNLFTYNLKQRHITSMMILEGASMKEFNDLPMYYVYSAIQLLKRENPYTGQRERVMDIVKMRNTNTTIQLIPYEINPSGIVVHPPLQDDYFTGDSFQKNLTNG
ncbi:MAG: ATPase domain-containing protein [Thermoplasmata archaeon]